VKRNAYTTMQRARSLRERQPDASPSLVAVALALATFADGPTGAMIRPGLNRVANITGLSARQVQRHVAWLVTRGELRRDKLAWPGSAACYAWIGGMDATQETPIRPECTSPGSDTHVIAVAPHQSNRSDPSGLPGPRAGEPLCVGCGGSLGYLIEGDDDGSGALCLRCFHAR
jgi:hypothetical protein